MNDIRTEDSSLATSLATHSPRPSKSRSAAELNLMLVSWGIMTVSLTMTGTLFCGFADLLNLGLLVLRGFSFISPFTFTGLVVFALAPVLLYRPGRNPPLNRYFGRSVIVVLVHYAI
jgi:hypothetical protein